MSLTLSFYNGKRDALLEQLDQYSFILNDIQNENERQRILELKDQVLHEQFQIVVVGEFSRGKSTFINALLGEKLLPSFARPTTTILNTISYHPEPMIKLHFREESKGPREISEEKFKELIAPKDPIVGDEESEREFEEIVEYLQSIKFAEIGYPLSFCKSGVQIIDTPGTNDLDPAREQITNTIIPSSDAAILILSATKILSESEISFLRDRLLANDIQKIFVVINFKDLLKSEEDIQKVMNYAEENLKPILGNPKIHLVAAKQALNTRRAEKGEVIRVRGKEVKVWEIADTGFPELERSLADFLQHDRGKVKLQKPIQRTVKSIDEVLEKQIRFEKHSLTTKIEDLHERVNKVRENMKKLKVSGNQALSRIDVELQKEEEMLHIWYERELDGISQRAIDVFDDNDHLSTDKISRKVESAVAPLERDLHEAKKKKIEGTVKKVIEKASQTVNQEWFKLDSQFKSLVNGDSEVSNLPSTSINYDHTPPSASIFEEIYEDLGDAWGSSGFFGKVAIGAGFVVTGIVDGVSSLVKAGWNWLFGGGESETTKMRRQVMRQFSDSKRNKSSQLRREWNGIRKGIQKQYEQIINNQLQQIEKQLKQLTENSNLEETDIQKRLEVLNRQESILTSIKDNILTTNHELNQSKGEQYVKL